ncbi:hypothetical protein MAPG_05936 [Magnaporthiopsis poae ATCC 64411]|uniref:Hsp70-like protein n=1 Tax=Magnaporthiopsis poae (strain ATCC 64411 / 73-15) TaxID=644358 RepID=A0A0C4E0Q4_MAGP6|nr:hypothetical protein MAPG_05936 [Magnaporthiopsis poae ATCC 64411]
MSTSATRASTQPIPDAIFGIDVGHSSAKVVGCFLLSNGEYSALTNITWPGCFPGHALPAVVAYNGTKAVVGEITPTTENNDAYAVFTSFKFAALATDPEQKTIKSVRGNSTGNAQGVLIMFLRRVFEGVENFYNANRANLGHLPTWGTAIIDFEFSVPSLLDENARRILVNSARQAAGLSANSRRKHTVREITLTEAEAVAVGAVNTLRRLNDNVGKICMVVDIGAGTSDVAMLALVDESKGKAKDKAKGKAKGKKGKSQIGIKADFLDPVSSTMIGGSLVDEAFRNVLVEYMTPLILPWCDGGSPSDCAREICRSQEYFTAKATVTKATTERNHLEISLPGLEPGASIDAARQGGLEIVGGQLCVDSAVFKQLYEEQLLGKDANCRYALDSIVAQVITMRDDLYVQKPSRSDVWKALLCRQPGQCQDAIDFLIFAGGMGASKYIQERLQEELGVGARPKQGEASTPWDYVTEHTELISHPQPQLCVALGLVRSRMAEVSPDSGCNYKGTTITRSKH